MNRSRPRAFEILCFAGVFFVIHFLVSVFFNYDSFSDSIAGSGGWGFAIDQLVQSIVTVSLATPAYLVLVSWYGKFRARREGSTGRDET